jgi:hypothetical protein
LTMKNAAFGDVTPGGSCKNRGFGGTFRLYHKGDKNRRARNVSSKQKPKHVAKKKKKKRRRT